MSKITPLYDWALETHPNDHYVPPECKRGISLSGYTHKEDKHRLITSYVVTIDGRNITTRSGSHYKAVGPARKDYLNWLKSKVYKYDSMDPFKWYKETLEEKSNV